MQPARMGASLLRTVGVISEGTHFQLGASRHGRRCEPDEEKVRGSLDVWSVPWV